MTFFEILEKYDYLILIGVSFIQFIFTLIITYILHRYSKDQLQLEVLRSIDSQWQELNKMRIHDPKIQEAILDNDTADDSVNGVMRKNIVLLSA